VEIVDAQLHEPAPWLAWSTSDVGTRRDVLTETLMTSMDAVGVDAAVLFPVEDPAWAQERAGREPHRFAWVPMLTGGDPTGHGRDAIKPDAPDLEEQIERAWARPGVVAIRIVPAVWPQEVARAKAGGYERAFAACEKQGIPVFLMVTGQLDLVATIAAAHPDLTLIVDHLGVPQPPAETPDTPPFQKLPELLALARYDNVAVKLCGVQALSEGAYPFEDVWPQVRELVAAFGADRLLWASDIGRFRGRVGWHVRVPGTERHYPGKHTYAESLSFYRDTQLLEPQEQELILGGTVRQLLRWPVA
jgi:predicted TIM-barrel fold metal-dependent hydrolase